MSLPSEEFITSWTFFRSWALKNLPNPCWADADAAARHSAMEASWALSSSATFAVGDCLEDINALTGQFRQRPGALLPGADTVGRGLKELAEENIVYKSETSGRSYSFNTAEKLNTLLLRMIRRMGLIKGSSIKCVDVFRIALTEEPKLCIIQKDSQDSLGYLLCYHPPTQKTFSCQYFENADNGLKNHDIISDKTSTDKGKNTYKKQVCNQQ